MGILLDILIQVNGHLGLDHGLTVALSADCSVLIQTECRPVSNLVPEDDCELTPERWR